MTPRVLVVQHEDDDPIHLMGTWMEGVELVVCRAYDGDAVPSSIDDYDGLVVMAAPWARTTTRRRPGCRRPAS